MKKLFTLIMVIFITFSSFAQAPQKMSYQCVIRNSSGVLITNQSVGIRISILHGSASGTPVYVETQTSTTNANGLVTIEIGGGIAVTGTFAGIDWSTGSYFIKTETDPTGGTTYTITGTSQILSVPYALQAKTAATADYNALTNLPTLNIANWNTAYGWGNHIGLYRPISYVPAWTDVTGKPTFATVATSGSYNDLKNKPIIDGSETKIVAGNNISVTGGGTTDNAYIVNAKAHYIGEYYGGGIVFFVYDEGLHGLISATTDQGSLIAWDGDLQEGYSRNFGARGSGVGAGFMNTSLIVSNQEMKGNQSPNCAAYFCANYSVISDGVRYGGWYLPSLYELSLLYLQKDVVGGFIDNYYWSSTEDNGKYVGYTWGVHFSNGSIYTGPNKSELSVRAIRAF